MFGVRVEDYREEVIGLRPVYTETGNATELFLASGKVLLDKRGQKSVIKALARAYAIDLTAQRQALQIRLGCKGMLPFHLDEKRVFVPLKLRRARVENDQVNGYMDVRYIKIEGNKGGGCRVLLSTGQVLEVLSSIDTANRSKHLGERLLEEMQPVLDLEEEQAVAAARFLVRTLKDIAARL
jgi:hypothetical protein